MKKIYLRVVEPAKLGQEKTMDIIEDIEEDKKYWKKYHPENKVTYYIGLKKVK